jgi:hypothetical protein
VHRNQQRTIELVALTAAAAHVYREIMGTAIEPMPMADSNAILQDVARAISKVVAIYGAIHERETPKPLPASTLMHGVFQRGAAVLRTPEGIEYRRLAVRRSDMRLAILIFQHVGARFGPATAQ